MAPVGGPTASHQAPLELSVARQLTSLADINRALVDVGTDERGVEAELEALLAARAGLERDLARLAETAAEPLRALKANAQALASNVTSTAALSERVSRKVRQLDVAQSRVHLTLTHITATVGRTEAVDGLRRALDAEDFEGAAAHIAQFRDLEARFVSATTAKVDDRQMQEQHDAVGAARTKLASTIHARLEVASRVGDHDSVDRFIRLYKPLDREAEGLAWFCAYLRKLVADRAGEAYTSLLELAGRAGGAAFIDALTSLFKDIASALDANCGLVTDTFGQAAILDVALALHEECDVHGARVLQRYAQHRCLATLVQQTTMVAASPVKGGGGDGAAAAAATAAAAVPIDPRQVEAYLEEILVLYQRSEEYNQYLLACMANAVTPEPLGGTRENAFRSGQFNITVRELVSSYINLEEYYLEQNVKKAIAIDEWSAGSLLSSMVDDVFFIVQKSCRRALATGNIQCACTVLSQGNGMLASQLRAALDARWKSAALRLVQLLTVAVEEGAAATNEAASQAAVFNNLEASAGYVGKLRTDLESFAGDVFPAPSARDRVQSILADLTKTAGDFDAIAARAVEQLANGLMPRIRPFMDEVSTVNFELSETQYAANEVSESWVQRFLVALMACLQYLSPILSPALYDAVVSNILDKVVDRVEALLRLKRFNQLGGLQLDRNIRDLVTSLADVTQRSVRDKFARLTQVATLLSCESMAEVQEFFGPEASNVAYTWRLSDTQIREVLSQRHDFSQVDIARLVL